MTKTRGRTNASSQLTNSIIKDLKKSISFLNLPLHELNTTILGKQERGQMEIMMCEGRQDESKLLTIVRHGFASLRSYLLHHLISSRRTLSAPFNVSPKVIHFITTRRKRLAIMG